MSKQNKEATRTLRERAETILVKLSEAQSLMSELVGAVPAEVREKTEPNGRLDELAALLADCEEATDELVAQIRGQMNVI